ncbi:MAG: type II toxin-antitoxin system PemK/MazF family toxin [Synechococcaceae cyanobacterium]
MNTRLRTLIIAPLTSDGHPSPLHIPCHFGEEDGHIVIDQIRAVDRDRSIKRLGA